MRRRELAHPQAAAGKRFKHAAARRVGERGEHAVQDRVFILNHKV